MNPWLLAAAVNGFVAVAMGAFASHGLAQHLDARALDWVQTGSRYEMWHALALLWVAWSHSSGKRRFVDQIAGWGFLVGAALFSGSLYAMAITSAGWLAFVTPLGGAGFLVGWLALAWSALSQGRGRRA